MKKKAQELYVKIMSSRHENFQVRDSGLIISTQHPYLGASPDGIISCDCCGIGVNEINAHTVKRIRVSMRQMKINDFVCSLLMEI